MDKTGRPNDAKSSHQVLPILGLVGGMAPESTAIYYRAITASVSARLGEHEAPEILLHSLNFAALYRAVSSGDPQTAIDAICNAALGLDASGAALLAICSNTGHMAAQSIRDKTSTPIIHIGDAIGDEVLASGATSALLLGTSAMASADCISNRLKDRGIRVSFPDKTAQEHLDAIIFGQLAKGDISEDAIEHVSSMITKAHLEGVGAVVLACTELSLIAEKLATDIPIIDSTQAHVRAIVAALFTFSGNQPHV